MDMLFSGQSLWRVFLATFLLVVVHGCGGGGSGGGAGSAEPSQITYTGNSGPAVITPTNAAILVDAVIGSDEARQFVPASFEDGSHANPESVSVIGQSLGIVSLPKYISQYVGRFSGRDHEDSPSNRITASAIDVNETTPCHSGSVRLAGTLSDGGEGTIALSFQDCRLDEITANGDAAFVITSFDNILQLPTESRLTFSALKFSGPDLNGTMAGSIHVRLIPGQNKEIVTSNIVVQDDSIAKTYKVENLVISTTYTSNFFILGVSQTMSGRVFDPSHGYVDISTPTPLIFENSTSNGLRSGDILLKGTQNRKILVSTYPSALLVLQLDIDGNGSYEITATVLQNELTLQRNSDLSDSDGDGMHNSWEAAFGLNPFSSADAELDLDGDDGSNILEYRVGRDPGISQVFSDLCEELDQLAESLGAGLSFIVDDVCPRVIVLGLGGDGFDIVLDDVRQQIYVSVPSRNEITVISLTSFGIVDRILLSGSPYGIDLSLDGSRLFAALFDSNAVAVIDLASRSVRTIDLADKSGDPRTYDVLEAEQDRLIVTSNPSSNGLAYVVQVRLDLNDSVSRVAGSQIIRARPVLARSRDSQFVYVGEGFGPNSLYKLSLADPNAGIVLEDNHGSVSGTDNLILNSSGTRIALSSGQVLRTGSFLEEGRIPSGYSMATSLGDELIVNTTAGILDFYDFDTLQLNDSVNTRCQLSGAARRLLPYSADQNFILMRDSQVCLTANLSQSIPVDPYPELRFSDLALEGCVIAAAMSQGFSGPEDFTQLDCSTSVSSIRSLEGIGALSNLQQLDISNSDVFDLAPLTSLNSLQGLTAQNASIEDVGPLVGLSLFNLLNVVDNPGINCSQLNELVAGGVSVFANFCAEKLRLELGGIGFDLEVDATNNRAFVSVPSLQAIIEIDLATFSIARILNASQEPRGIDLSADRTTLYAALNNIGTLAYIDTSSGAEQLVNLSALLDDDRTYDVAEVSQDRIVVSSSPGSNGLAYIVEVRRDQGNAAKRVASDRIIRATPFFAVSNDGSSLYVGAGFSPNSIYKLDANQATLPIIAEDVHGSIGGAQHFSINPDGSLIYTMTGQILSANTIVPIGQLASGISVVSADNAVIFVADGAAEAIGVYDTVNLNRIGHRDSGCSLQTVSRIAELGGDGILVMGDDLLCGSRTVPY